MKLLVLSNLYPPHYVGGYELHCQTIVEALRARGHQVVVLTSDHGFSRTAVPPRETGVLRSLKLHGLFGHPFVGIFQLQDLERHNNQVLVSTLRDFSPDLVYAWNFSGLSKSMLFTLQRIGTPTVLALCDHWLARSSNSDVWISWWNRPAGTLRHRALRLLWTISRQRRVWHSLAPTNPMRHLQVRAVHFCSIALKQFTVAAGYDVGHGAVIYCPLDTEKFNGTPRRAHNALHRLLFVGRLTEDKGIETGLRAMALVRDKFAGQLAIYGRGDAAYEQQLISFVHEHKLPVTFNTLLDPGQMPEVYRAHDALLFTSEWEEPFALAPIEAMACGLPVIGTTTGGSKELFRDRENALVYPAGDPAGLARSILELGHDHSLRERLAQAGQEEVRRRFAVATITDDVESYLNQTLRCWKPSALPKYWEK